jgi:ABC-type sulfate transport system permease subunit
MADLALNGAPATPFRPATSEATWVWVALIAVTLGVLAVLLFAPLVTVFVEAARKASPACARRSTTPTPARRSS